MSTTSQTQYTSNPFRTQVDSFLFELETSDDIAVARVEDIVISTWTDGLDTMYWFLTDDGEDFVTHNTNEAIDALVYALQ
jgi:hypothetical protein